MLNLETAKKSTSVMFYSILIMIGVYQRNMALVQRHMINLYHLAKTNTIHQLTTMLSTSKNVLLSGHNHLLTTGADDPSLAGIQTIINVSGHQRQWLAGGYDLEIGYL